MNNGPMRLRPSCTWCLIFSTFLRDVTQGMFIITHSGLAMVGLSATCLVLALWLNPNWLRLAQSEVVGWLRERQVLLYWLPENTALGVTAMKVQDLPRAQAAAAEWLSRKYSIAPEPLAALVAEAHVQSKKSKLAPHLILAVMAIESNFHPYAQSPAGAQGLMQVMTEVHAKRYESYGGKQAAIDPIANLRVGVAVLSDVIRLRDGSIEEGLKLYLGGYGLTEDGGYVAKVLAVQAQLDRVVAGEQVPVR